MLSPHFSKHPCVKYLIQSVEYLGNKYQIPHTKCYQNWHHSVPLPSFAINWITVKILVGELDPIS